MMSSASSSKSVFISRRLSSQSPFHHLAKQGISIYDASLIAIDLLDFKIEQEYEAVFFYSRTAIRHFFEKGDYRSNIQYGVMGQPSADAFENSCGYCPDIIGGGNLDLLCQQLQKDWATKKILFPQANVSLRTVESRLQYLHCIPLVIYNNTVKKDIEVPETNIALLTSPMNAEAYLSKYNITDKVVMAIGATTANYIQNETGLDVPYCKRPSMNSLYELLLDYLNTEG